MKSYILLLGLLLGGFTAYADSTAKKETEAILIGHVVDSRSGEHLPFITITVKGTTIGTWVITILFALMFFLTR